jgi:hypothetical protein
MGGFPRTFHGHKIPSTLTVDPSITAAELNEKLKEIIHEPVHIMDIPAADTLAQHNIKNNDTLRLQFSNRKD